MQRRKPTFFNGVKKGKLFHAAYSHLLFVPAKQSFMASMENKTPFPSFALLPPYLLSNDALWTLEQALGWGWIREWNMILELGQADKDGFLWGKRLYYAENQIPVKILMDDVAGRLTKSGCNGQLQAFGNIKGIFQQQSLSQQDWLNKVIYFDGKGIPYLYPKSSNPPDVSPPIHQIFLRATDVLSVFPASEFRQQRHTSPPGSEWVIFDDIFCDIECNTAIKFAACKGKFWDDANSWQYDNESTDDAIKWLTQAAIRCGFHAGILTTICANVSDRDHPSQRKLIGQDTFTGFQTVQHFPESNGNPDYLHVGYQGWGENLCYYRPLYKRTEIQHLLTVMEKSDVLARQALSTASNYNCLIIKYKTEQENAEKLSNAKGRGSLLSKPKIISLIKNYFLTNSTDISNAEILQMCEAQGIQPLPKNMATIGKYKKEALQDIQNEKQG